MTYSRRGAVNRPDMKYHAIVYTGSHAPEALPGEELDLPPIRIRAERGEALQPQSRINFSKIYTIEHNVKVKEVGRVTAACMPLLSQHFRQSLDLDVEGNSILTASEYSRN